MKDTFSHSNNRYGAAKDEPLQPGSKIVYLIRHGQSTANVAKLNNIPRSDPEKFRGMCDPFQSKILLIRKY